MTDRDSLQRWVNAVEFLKTHDLPCPHCGYNLRGSTTAKCPECGRDVDIVGLLEGRLPDAPSIAQTIWTLGPKFWVLCVNLACWCGVNLLARGTALEGYILLVVALIGIWLTWWALEAWDGSRFSLERLTMLILTLADGSDIPGRLWDLAKFFVPLMCFILTGIHGIVVLRLLLR